MFDENQLVEMQWNNATKKWYESKGYRFTKKGDSFVVKAKDLKPSSNKHVFVICDYCGKEVKRSYCSFNISRERGEKDSCYDCRGQKHREDTFGKRAKEQFDKLIEICNKNGYELITTADEYVDVFMDIEYICPKHGKQKQQLRCLTGGYGCWDCGNEKISESRRLSIEQVRNIVESINGNIWLNPDEYIGYSTTNLKIMCECGDIYITSLASYVQYSVTKCPKCANSESKMETCIKNILRNNNISFEQEKRFSDCKDVNMLPFDFYLNDFNICIEFNGKQHYEPIEHFGGECGFESRQKHDRIKQEYCAKNGIKLIIIPYWEEDNIENIIVKELNL